MFNRIIFVKYKADILPRKQNYVRGFTGLKTKYFFIVLYIVFSYLFKNQCLKKL